MQCRDCPYGKYDFENKMNRYIKDLGFTTEEAADIIEEFVQCEKIDGVVYQVGHCDNFYEENMNLKSKKVSNKKKNYKRERYLKYKNHLKRLERMGFYRRKHASPVTYTDEVWIKGPGWIENSKPYYKRWYRGKRSKYLKNQSDRKIRRYKGELYNGYQCHKLFDYWWELT